MKAAEGLAAITAIVEEVAFLLNQHAALVAGEESHREVIGEGARGEPHGSLLTEGRCHGLLKPGNYSAQ
jgi:hypothetical protein